MASRDVAAERLVEAYELLSSYVSHGSMQADDQFDETFARLAEMVPRSLVRPIARAHRVVVIPRAELDALRAGGTTTLRPRAHGSWARSERAALMCLRSRFAAMGDDMAALVVAKSIRTDQVVVDVQRVYETLGFDCGTVEEWGLYASWEEEVIVRQDAAMLTLSIRDVSHAFLPGDHHALRPFGGEVAWSEDAQDLVVVDAVADAQPGAPDGLWDVTVDGADVTVRWDARGRSWEIDPTGPEARRGP